MTVLAGYQPIPSAPACPYCGDRHYAVEDDGDEATYLIRCWCGAKCRCRKDDPDMAAHLAQLDRQNVSAGPYYPDGTHVRDLVAEAEAGDPSDYG